VVLVPGRWDSEHNTASKRQRHAQELLQPTHSGAEFFAEGLQTMAEDHEFDPENPQASSFDTLKPVESSGGMSAGIHIAQRYIDGALQPWDQVAILRVPAASPHELPAYLEWGGWNDVPEPQMIVAVARYWGERYGSELVAIGPDLLEFSVARPPADHASAVALLREHYIFAPDNYEIDQDFLEQCAAELPKLRNWVFWWD
jgi:hypothetical protein